MISLKTINRQLKKLNKNQILMKSTLLSLTIASTVLSTAATSADNDVYIEHAPIYVERTSTPITIDGKMTETQWDKARWLPIDNLLLGEQPSKSDFTGDYKLLWDQDYLYLLARIVDDVLFDKEPEPTKAYWDDDCLEIFIDEDNSGGDHLNNFNAFAYHLALDTQVADIAPAKDGGMPAVFKEHVINRWQRSGTSASSDSEPEQQAIYWEAAIKLYSADYVHRLNEPETHRVFNQQGKKLGFMLAYCDNDGSDYRESFIGSHPIKPINGDKNLGYKTADVFGDIVLK